MVAHAMGRTLVVPPQQHLYLLGPLYSNMATQARPNPTNFSIQTGKPHKDKDDKEVHDEMGFEDFFDVNLLCSHKGFHVLRMARTLIIAAAYHATFLILISHRRTSCSKKVSLGACTGSFRQVTPQRPGVTSYGDISVR